ncbi:glycosyltransferase family 2 protein [Paenirhodobacter sp.]|uniref:glycosyltransferase family 2 protein n=1 Tax=Paenirhodobacter sp. TaxID=1965326 RepID=UPI003B402F51
MAFLTDWKARYRLRRKRQLLLLRAFRHRRDLTPMADRSGQIRPGAILLFATVRAEARRLPAFLEHYRKIGVDHFLIVDNASRDGTAELLATQPDVSLWTTGHSYRDSRFGMDWLTWLMIRHGHGHWCLTVDADELLVLPHHGTRGLRDLTAWLDSRGIEAVTALMLDLYPQGPLSTARLDPLTDSWFDPWGYDWQYQPRFGNISIRGGPRQRVFFADRPQQAPHLHKTPLIRWNRRHVYVSSTHIALPPRLNTGFDARRNQPTGVLLHTKFLDQPIPHAREEKCRREHFTEVDLYDSYYDRVIADPVLWHPQSQRYENWAQLEALGLMTRGGWT